MAPQSGVRALLCVFVMFSKGVPVSWVFGGKRTNEHVFSLVEHRRQFGVVPSSRRHTGMVDESKEDLMAAYKLDPTNKAVRKELQLLKASPRNVPQQQL